MKNLTTTDMEALHGGGDCFAAMLSWTAANLEYSQNPTFANFLALAAATYALEECLY
jgi:hypothetical protein